MNRIIVNFGGGIPRQYRKEASVRFVSNDQIRGEEVRGKAIGGDSYGC